MEEEKPAYCSLNTPILGFQSGKVPPCPPTLFINANGRPLTFYVPFTLKEHNGVAAIIRAGCGLLTDDVKSADYVILGLPDGILFETAWAEAHLSNRRIVTSAFVIDSLKNQTVVDPALYRSSQQPNHLKPQFASQSTNRATAVKSQDAGSTSMTWLRRFKLAERSSSLEDVVALLQAYPELEWDALATLLHHKYPTHSVKAWKRFVSHHQTKIDDLLAESSTCTGSPPTPESAGVAGSEPTLKVEPLDESVIMMEFAFAVSILEEWDGAKGSDAKLWLRMETTLPCSSAPTWEAFCNRHCARFKAHFASGGQQRIGDSP